MGPKRILVVTCLAVGSVVVGAPFAGARTLDRSAASVVTPRTVGVVSHTYTVTTLSDAKLLNGAPAHTCEDAGAPTKCSLRAALTVANDDFGAAAGQWDVIKVPKGTIDLASGNATFGVVERGALSIEGAGPGLTVIDGSTDHFDAEVLSLDATGASLSITGLTINGGASPTAGGAIDGTDTGAITVSDCSFVDNDATTDGGAIAVDDSVALTVTDSAFSHNSAVQEGGAIADTSGEPLTLSDDTFSDNTVGPTSPTDAGGAIFATVDVSVDHSSFVTNTAAGPGGAIDAEGNVTATDDSFTDNGSRSNDGGAIYASRDVLATASLFTSNGAVDGGALYVNDVGSISGDDFASNAATDDGSDVYDDDQVTADNSTFTKGDATNSGGSIYVNDSALTLLDDSITDSFAHDASTYEGGGAIYGLDASLSLVDTTLKGDQAPGAGGSGGAIGTDDASVDITGGSIANDRSGYEGGGLSLYDSPDAVIDDATITGNVSPWGGGVFASGATIVMDDDSVSNNISSLYWGGGLALDDGTDATISNSTLSGNRADGTEGYGGGLSAYGTGAPVVVGLANDTVANNSAVYGGGVYEYESDATFASSTVAYNTTGTNLSDGGGIYANSSAVTSTDTIWASNAGRQCAGTGYAGHLVASDGGDNLDSDNSCGFDAPGDLVNKPGNLGVLAHNGGPTETIFPLGTSLVLGHGGPACPAYDQRGVHATGAPCSIGAVFAVATKTALTLTHASVAKGHETAETFTVTVTSTMPSTAPSGNVAITVGHVAACSVSLHAARTGLVAHGTCAPTASAIPVGSATVTATYLGAGALSESVATAKLTVTA